LLVACEASEAKVLLQRIVDAGNPSAHIIGHAEAGTPGIRVSV